VVVGDCCDEETAFNGVDDLVRRTARTTAATQTTRLVTPIAHFSQRCASRICAPERRHSFPKQVSPLGVTRLATTRGDRLNAAIRWLNCRPSGRSGRKESTHAHQNAEMADPPMPDWMRSVGHALRRPRHGRRHHLGVFSLVIALIGIGVGLYLVAQPSRPSAARGSPPSGSVPQGLRPSTTTSTVPPPPYAVQSETITLTDPTRDTPARGSVPGHPGRVLVTDIRRPAGLHGRLPLVVFAHGWNSDPAVYEPLLNSWAAAGFVVAAPTFPDSADTLPGTPVSNYPDQARDMTFVISSLLHGSAGLIDRSRIAVAGHSDGGTDVAIMALNPAFADPRVRAYLSLSGEIPDGISGPWGAPSAAALLVAVGTEDQYGLFDPAVQIFQTASMPRVLLTLAGGDHLTTFIGSTPAEAAMRADTVNFLHLVFSSHTVTSSELGAALASTGDPAIAEQAGSN